MSAEPRAQRLPRALAYVRVSKEGGRGEALLSPDLQLNAIRDHCGRHGYEISQVLTDIDRTGREWKGRQIEGAIKSVESGNIDVIVVWRTSRVSRIRLDWAMAVDRVESVGGRLESATEPNENTSTGRFSRGILAELNAFESERMSETWREVHSHRRQNGLPHYAPARLGYSYSRASGYLVDPDAAPIVRELYRRYIDGAGLGSLARWLSAQGIVGNRGKPWTLFGVSYYLRSGFAAGLLHEHDPNCVDAATGRPCQKKRGSCGNRIHRKGAHESIISETTFHLAMAVKRGRGAPQSRTSRSKLAGSVICTGCERPMQLQNSSGKSSYAYVCRTNKAGQTTSSCTNPGWVRRSVVEDLVFDWLGREAATLAEQVKEAIRTGTDPEPAEDLESRRARLLAVIERKEAALVSLLATAHENGFTKSQIEGARRVIIDNQNAARAELRTLPTASQRTATSGDVRGVLELWQSDASPREIAPVVRELVRIRVTRPGGVELVPVWVGNASS